MPRKLTPDEKALARAVEIIVSIDPGRLSRARSGKTDSGRVGVPWHTVCELADALEEARPGWVERTREATAAKNGPREIVRRPDRMKHEFSYDGNPERKMLRATCRCGWAAFGLVADVDSAEAQWKNHARGIL